MDIENQKVRAQRLGKWFKRKKKRDDPFSSTEVSDRGEDDDSSDYLDSVFGRSREMDPCTSTNVLTNELRIFVGTWNVAGRSPIGSLAVDLDEWLNLKDAADMYVIGFQEIIPLKAINVIGAEDLTEATNWNMLIGKTLNGKYGCPWLTPMLNIISSDSYHYAGNPNLRRKNSFSGIIGTPTRERPKNQHDNLHGSSQYKLMASKKMVGVFISVWMRKEMLRKYCISNVKVCSVACGIMGYLGNKGAVSVSMTIEGTSFCFIAAHLASGEKKGDEVRRNHQVSEIFRRTSFGQSPKNDTSSSPLTILGHDRIFWFGDLNYRLCLEDSFARQLIKKQDWRALQEFDQLRREQKDGRVFHGWKEGSIDFAPTYKYSAYNINCYSGGLPGRSGEKQRTPAWCDRILWSGREIKQLSYFRTERVVAMRTILPTIRASKRNGLSDTQ